MQSLERLTDWLRARAENIVALMLASMFVTFLIQIVFRYVLNLPLGWTVEYVAIAWLWGILFGYAFVVRNDDIIRFDLVYFAVPPAARRVMDIITGLTCAAILVWSLPKVWDYVTFMGIERTAYMRIRFDYVFAIYLPFAITVIIRCLVDVWHALRGTGHHATPAEKAEHEDYV